MLLIRGTPESNAEASSNIPFGYAGLFFFVVGLVSLNLVITKGASMGWASSWTLGLGALCLAAVVIFFTTMLRKKQFDFIDFALFKNHPYSVATFSNFMLNAVACRKPLCAKRPWLKRLPVRYADYWLSGCGTGDDSRGRVSVAESRRKKKR